MYSELMVELLEYMQRLTDDSDDSEDVILDFSEDSERPQETT